MQRHSAFKCTINGITDPLKPVCHFNTKLLLSGLEISQIQSINLAIPKEIIKGKLNTKLKTRLYTPGYILAHKSVSFDRYLF